MSNHAERTTVAKKPSQSPGHTIIHKLQGVISHISKAISKINKQKLVADQIRHITGKNVVGKM